MTGFFTLLIKSPDDLMVDNTSGLVKQNDFAGHQASRSAFNYTSSCPFGFKFADRTTANGVCLLCRGAAVVNQDVKGTGPGLRIAPPGENRVLADADFPQGR